MWRHKGEQAVAHGAAGRADLKWSVVRRGPVNGVVMQRKMIDNQHPSTSRQRRPVARIIVSVVVCVLLVVSVIWCVATLSSPGRFIFLPGGDVGLGFRSHGGWLHWIEYAPWMNNPDYVQWSLPWIAVFVAEALVIALCLAPWQSGNAA
jgi:hypothetical protein